MYYVVFKDENSKCRWTGYKSKAEFDNKYQRGLGEIVAEGVTLEKAMDLCGAPETMITDEDKGE